VSDEPWSKRFLRFALIGVGGSAILSAVIGVISAYQLVEPSDEQAVGITPRDFLISYAVMAAVGGVMIFLGWRLRRKK
jgi:integral membrane sensor domain MASE1